jgi:queuine tRNA-ribosyltransferase
MNQSSRGAAISPDAPFFSVLHGPTGAGPKLGLLKTAHGEAETPCFLPVASHGTLRAITFPQALAVGTKVLMANAWHVRRGTTEEALRDAGGAHGLLGWPGILFTDSGGYQVFSLRENTELTDQGVSFGGELLDPQAVIRMQKELGSDIMIALDDCAPFPCEIERAAEAVRRTTLWGRQCDEWHQKLHALYGRPQFLYGIVQGGTFPDLRIRSIAEAAELPFDGFGIGGLSIGMPRSEVREMTRMTCAGLPAGKPRHLLGVGLPDQILEGIADGADTFDCVLPIRKAQRGIVYTRFGEVRYKDPAPGRAKDQPLDRKCPCSTCASYSREQLRVLYRTERERAGELASIHNLAFYHEVLQGAREAIREDRFPQFFEAFLSRWRAGAATAAPPRAKRPLPATGKR